MGVKELAIEWWENLSNIESIGLERKYGYYGHDQGISEDELIHMYKEEVNPPLKKELDKDFINSAIFGKDYLEVTIGDFNSKQRPNETKEQFKTRLQIELDNNGFDVEVV